MVPLDSDRISPVPPYSGYWLGIKRISPTGLSPSMVWLSSHVLLHVLSPYHQSYNPQDAVTSWVWAVSRSLATTWEITLVFFSSAYLDVSVQQVRLRINTDIPTSSGWVAPFGNLRIIAYLQLPEAYRSLSRPSSPLRA